MCFIKGATKCINCKFIYNQVLDERTVLAGAQNIKKLNIYNSVNSVLDKNDIDGATKCSKQYTNVTDWLK